MTPGAGFLLLLFFLGLFELWLALTWPVEEKEETIGRMPWPEGKVNWEDFMYLQTNLDATDGMDMDYAQLTARRAELNDGGIGDEQD
jgi:hypothetical protein